MVEEGRRGLDKQQQLFRRITDITYCFIDAAGEHQRYTIPMSQYRDYDDLKEQAAEHLGALTYEGTQLEISDDDSKLPF